MGVFTCNTYWVHELMMLFVNPLVERESLVFAMQHSMRHMESKVFTSDQDKHMTYHFPRIWKTCYVHSPWKLPVVHVCCEGKADAVKKDVIKHALKQSSFNKFSPTNWINLPRPWIIFLNFKLLEESVLTTVYQPENCIQTQNHACSEEDDIADEKLWICELVTFWQPHAVGWLFLGNSLHSQALHDSFYDIWIQAIHYLRPHILRLSWPVPKEQDSLGPSNTIPKRIFAEKVVDLDIKNSWNVKVRLLLLGNLFLSRFLILHRWLLLLFHCHIYFYWVKIKFIINFED